MGAGRAEKVEAGHPGSRHTLNSCSVPGTTVSAGDSALSPSPIFTGVPGGSAGDMVQSLGRGDPLEEDVATHSRILAWRIPLDGGAWLCKSMPLQRVRHNLGTKPPPSATIVKVKIMETLKS